MDLKEEDARLCTGVHQVQWRAVVKTVMNIRAPLNSGKILDTRVTIRFSKRTSFMELNLVSSWLRYH